MKNYSKATSKNPFERHDESIILTLCSVLHFVKDDNCDGEILHMVQVEG